MWVWLMLAKDNERGERKRTGRDRRAREAGKEQAERQGEAKGTERRATKEQAERDRERGRKGTRGERQMVEIKEQVAML